MLFAKQITWPAAQSIGAYGPLQLCFAAGYVGACGPYMLVVKQLTTGAYGPSYWARYLLRK